MKIKSFNNSTIIKKAYYNQIAQKNQIAFQGLNFIKQAKETAFLTGIEMAPLGIIPDPMHFGMTYLVYMYTNVMKNGQKFVKLILNSFEKNNK